MKQLFKFLSSYKKSVFSPLLFKLFEATLELFVPLVMAAIIDHGIGSRDYGFIGWMGGILVLFGSGWFDRCSCGAVFCGESSCGFAAGLRQALFRHIQSLSFGDVDQVGSSTLITRLTSDTNQSYRQPLIWHFVCFCVRRL